MPIFHDYNVDHTCPFCGAVHDGALKTAGKEGGPNDGDAGICLDCAAVFVFSPGSPGGTREPTASEWEEMRVEPSIIRAVRAVEAARKEHGRAQS